MDLLRAWARQIAAASVAAVCVPLAIGCALVVIAFTGGFGSLGSLEEMFSGPRAASVPAPVIRLAPVVSPRPPVAPPRPPVASPAPRLAVARARVGPAVRVGADAPVSRTSAPMDLGATPVAPAARTAEPVRPLRAPAPPARPGTADRVVGLAASLTDKLPPPVGPPASQAVRSLAAAVPPPVRVSVP